MHYHLSLTCGIHGSHYPSIVRLGVRPIDAPGHEGVVEPQLHHVLAPVAGHFMSRRNIQDGRRRKHAARLGSEAVRVLGEGVLL